MTDWIEHTTDTCPVDPETVVEVLLPGHARPSPPRLAAKVNWNKGAVAYYRTASPAKPPEPEMAKTAQEHAAAMFATATTPITSHQPMDGHNLITLRLECMKLAVGMLDRLTFQEGSTVADVADDLLHYVLNGSVDKA